MEEDLQSSIDELQKQIDRLQYEIDNSYSEPIQGMSASLKRSLNQMLEEKAVLEGEN